MNKNNKTRKSNSNSNINRNSSNNNSDHDSRTNGTSKSNSINPNTSKKNEGSNSAVSSISPSTGTNHNNLYVGFLCLTIWINLQVIWTGHQTDGRLPKLAIEKERVSGTRAVACSAHAFLAEFLRSIGCRRQNLGQTAPACQSTCRSRLGSWSHLVATDYFTRPMRTGIPAMHCWILDAKLTCDMVAVAEDFIRVVDSSDHRPMEASQ